jgi:membrane protein required for colicin V production
MTLLDISLLVPILWFGFKGLRNGAIMELVQLVAVALGVVIACKFSHFVGDYFEVESKHAGIIYFAMTFIAVVGMLFLAGYILEKFVQAILLGWLNRILGLVFAVVKTVLILSVLIFYFNKIDQQETILPKEQRDESLLFRPIEQIAPIVMPIATETIEKWRTDVEKMENNAEEMDNNVEEMED